MGNAETSQNTPQQAVPIPSPASLGEPAVPVGGVAGAALPTVEASPGVGQSLPQQQSVASPRYTTAQQPLMPATRPAAGLKTVPDLRLRRLMGVSAWGLFLGIAGLVLGAIALFRLMGDMPGWFEPVFAGTGVFGLILVIASFITVRYRMIPWMLLSASSITFVIGVVLLGSA